jgi:hypothetical protein
MTMTPMTRILLATLLVSTSALAGDIPTERVQFAKGANSATIEGRIQGDMSVANYFNIIEPGRSNEAMFVGSISGNQFEGVLPASGDYKVRVYLMRSAARRDDIANYRLEMIID